jgi:hypothetical protein
VVLVVVPTLDLLLQTVASWRKAGRSGRMYANRHQDGHFDLNDAALTPKPWPLPCGRPQPKRS